MEVEDILKEASGRRSENRRLIKKLKRVNAKNLDEAFSTEHEVVFEEVDCLSCANCCKTTSPRLLHADIERIAKRLRMKVSAVMEKYVITDEDGDMVFNATPCPFLGDDNYCSVYDSRPKACREYPHTDRKRIHQLLNLSLKNTEVCPAVCKIFDGLREKYI